MIVRRNYSASRDDNHALVHKCDRIISPRLIIWTRGLKCADSSCECARNEMYLSHIQSRRLFDPITRRVTRAIVPEIIEIPACNYSSAAILFIYACESKKILRKKNKAKHASPFYLLKRGRLITITKSKSTYIKTFTSAFVTQRRRC